LPSPAFPGQGQRRRCCDHPSPAGALRHGRAELPSVKRASTSRGRAGVLYSCTGVGTTNSSMSRSRQSDRDHRRRRTCQAPLRIEGFHSSGHVLLRRKPSSEPTGKNYGLRSGQGEHRRTPKYRVSEQAAEYTVDSARRRGMENSILAEGWTLTRRKTFNSQRHLRRPAFVGVPDRKRAQKIQPRVASLATCKGAMGSNPT
jgi:hypothetical protein